MLEPLARFVRSFDLPWNGAALLALTLLILFAVGRLAARGALFASYVVVKNTRTMGMSPPVALVWLEDVIWFVRERLRLLLIIGLAITAAWTVLYLARDWFQGDGPIGTLERRASFRIAHELGIVVPAYGPRPNFSEREEARPEYVEEPEAREMPPSRPQTADIYQPTPSRAAPKPEDSASYYSPPVPVDISEPRRIEPRASLSIERPEWTRRPSERDIARAFPRSALDDNVGGTALLECVVRSGGTVDCQVIEESPAGYGFGEAALRMSSRFRHAMWLDDGRSAIGGHVRVRLTWTTT